MTGGKVVGYVQMEEGTPVAFSFQNSDATGCTEPLVLQSDLAAAIAKVEPLRAKLADEVEATRRAQQRAEQAEWNEVAAIARAEAAEAKLSAMEQDAREIYAQIPGLPVTPETCDAATDVLTRFCIDFNAALAAQQAEGEASWLT